MTTDLGMPSGKKLGPVFTVSELADVLGWSTRRTRRVLRRLGVVKDLRGCQALVTYSDLLEHAPSVYYSLLAVGAVEANCV